MAFLRQILFLIIKVLVLDLSQAVAAQPQASLKNGTYIGKHVTSYNQDLFLGIPYAQPPLGDLRLQNPQSLNTSFVLKNATDYADSCVGYGNSASWPFTLSEDCLTLNIVRPTGHSENASLPVGVFIHGGGYIMDYSANGAYNLSFFVNQSVAINKPIIAVSLDYRLSAWGFLASQDILDAGIANLGLKDQRMALHFVKENIAAFGGDPEKIVIWGESAGGRSVGYHATAYGGKDEGLFRGIIAASPAEGTQLKSLAGPTERYNNITRAVGCDTQSDKLACLRKVPFTILNEAIKNLTLTSFFPVVDGDFITDYSSTLLAQGSFTKTPMLIGTNSDEGTLFVTPPVNSDVTIANAIEAFGPDSNTTTIIMELYPNVDSLGLPATYQTTANSTVGTQYKRAVVLSTDQTFLAPRRLRTNAWSRAGVPIYSYLFDSPVSTLPSNYGTPHFSEIRYVFYDLLGLGYTAAANPFNNATEPVLNLAKLMCRMWVSFIHDLDPNNHGDTLIETWPVYNATGGYGENFYLNPESSGVISDTFRLAGTTFINTVNQEQYGR